MAVFQVNSAEIASTARHVTSLAESIRAEVSGMLAQLHALEQSWQGSAATAFTEVVGQWQRTQTQVDDSLTQITTALNQSATYYEEAERTAVSMFR